MYATPWRIWTLPYIQQVHPGRSRTWKEFNSFLDCWKSAGHFEMLRRKMQNTVDGRLTAIAMQTSGFYVIIGQWPTFWDFIYGYPQKKGDVDMIVTDLPGSTGVIDRWCPSITMKRTKRRESMCECSVPEFLACTWWFRNPEFYCHNFLIVYT